MKSPLRPLKNRKTQKRKKKKWRFQLQLIQGNGPFPYFLERLLVLVLASCLRRWMATVDASDRSMPPYSLDFHLKKKKASFSIHVPQLPSIVQLPKIFCFVHWKCFFSI